jgi:hypothetical protein
MPSLFQEIYDVVAGVNHISNGTQIQCRASFSPGC